jgi:hypothetical protein
VQDYNALLAHISQTSTFENDHSLGNFGFYVVHLMPFVSETMLGRAAKSLVEEVETGHTKGSSGSKRQRQEVASLEEDSEPPHLPSKKTSRVQCVIRGVPSMYS